MSSPNPPYSFKVSQQISASVPLVSTCILASDITRVELDYSQWLALGETLAAVVFSCTPVTVPPLVSDLGTISTNNAGFSAALAMFNLSGGLAGVAYQTTFTATTNLARVKTDVLVVNVSAGVQTGYPGGYPVSDVGEYPTPPTVWVGSGTPWNTLGTDGDYFFNEASVLMYGPRAGGVWPADPCYTIPSWYSPNSVV